MQTKNNINFHFATTEKKDNFVVLALNVIGNVNHAFLQYFYSILWFSNFYNLDTQQQA